MAVVERMFAVPPERVWQVLADGFSYCDWVVGATTIRDVDPGFPTPGTSLHYRIGLPGLDWVPGLRKDGNTEVLDCEPESRLRLEAHAWPAGTVAIDITLQPEGTGTRVRMDEVPNRGPAARFHNPVLDALTALRNRETLRRLERLSLTPARG